MVIVNLAGCLGREEVRQSLNFAESCKVGERHRAEEGEEVRGRRSISRKNV
jgi:hypothetical protein